MAILVWSLECIVDELNKGDIWHLNEIVQELIQNWTGDGRGKGSTDDKWKSIWSILYSSFSCKAYHQLPRWILFFPFGGIVDRVCATVLLKCSYFSGEALRKNVGRFLSLTVIMQLVFECSYHTNVDHLHCQICVPGFLSVQYTSFHFTFFLMFARNKWLSVCSSLFSSLHIYFRGRRRYLGVR